MSLLLRRNLSTSRLLLPASSSSSTAHLSRTHHPTTSLLLNSTSTSTSLIRKMTFVRADQPMGLKQLFDPDSCTYTYLLWDTETKDCVLVDPVDIQVERDMKEVQELGLNLVYGINTHAHADHITGTYLLKQQVPTMKSIISEASKAKADVTVQNGDRILFGNRSLKVKSTPGHTEGCVSYVADDESFVLTGDTLFIQGCGRTDFQGGSAKTLYESVHSQLFCLPKSCTVYPAHDYKSRTESTIGAEMDTNPRLGGGKTQDEFVEIMDNLNLSYPKKIDVAVPANMMCGYPTDAQ